MPCPFPGMDPYIELEYWSDFTPGFIKALANAMLPTLLPRYDVVVEEYIYVAHEEIRLHRLKPDLSVTTDSATWSSQTGTVTMMDLATEELDYPNFEPRAQRHLKLIHRSTRRVVTVIELLSPTNKKPGEDGLDAYLEKRGEYVASHCNLVEIDLLRGGERLPMAGELPPGDYYVYVGRPHRKPACQVIAWPWRAALPTVPIPLLQGDSELSVDLQSIFQTVYEQSLYDRRLSYQEGLVPPLTPSDADWVQKRLDERKTRS